VDLEVLAPAPIKRGLIEFSVGGDIDQSLQ
jgi:hypothetical protein